MYNVQCAVAVSSMKCAVCSVKCVVAVSSVQRLILSMYPSHIITGLLPLFGERLVKEFGELRMEDGQKMAEDLGNLILC